MKLLSACLLLFLFYQSFSQQNEFVIGAQILDNEENPVAEAYILNLRNSEKTFTGADGIFEIKVQPGDSLLISHISYFRKIINVSQILMNPFVQLKQDTIQLPEVRVKSYPHQEYQNAQKNIQGFQFSLKPNPMDGFTEKGRVQEMINRENGLQRSLSSTVDLKYFIPKKLIKKVKNEMKKKKERRKRHRAEKKRESVSTME